MTKLEIEAGNSSPSVRFDPESGLLEIGGESYPENSKEFYRPLIGWIEEFLEASSQPVTLRLTVTYMNTSSTKYMIDILDRLEAAHDEGHAVAVEWHCDAENGRALDTIEELKEDFEMPFEVISEWREPDEW
ncbi:MAG: SiaC family regulatory phosphoprotein [Spirochaetota bacterium]